MTHIIKLKTEVRLKIYDSDVEKYIDEYAQVDVSQSYCVVHWLTSLTHDDDRISLSVSIEKVEGRFVWEIYNGEKDPTKQAVEDSGVVKFSTEKGWTIHSTYPPEIEDEDSVFRLTMKPLEAVLDLKSKTITIESWGKDMSEITERVLRSIGKLPVTIDPAVRYERNPDGGGC